MLEEFNASATLENQQFEHNHTDQFESTEKQLFEQRMLEIESLLCAVGPENTNLRARLKGLEVQKDLQNAPIAATEIVVPPVAVNASNAAMKHVRLRGHL